MAIADDRWSVPESADRHLARLAAAQRGVFSRAQALSIGATDGMLQRRLATGRWERLFPGVYRLAGCAPSWRQSLIAACLAWGPGAVVSHRAAAALWRLAGFEPGPVELIVPRGRHRKLVGTVHRPLSLPRVDVTMLDAIPVTTPARTLLDLAATEPTDVVEEALDDALRRRLVTVPRLRWRLTETGGSGRPGVTVLRSLLDARGNASSVPQSVFETRLLRLLKQHGLLSPVVQHEIRDGGRLIAVVDLAFPRARVAIEAEGYRWHAGSLRWAHDLARRNAITALGWRVIHVTWSDLVDRPDETVGAVIRALER